MKLYKWLLIALVVGLAPSVGLAILLPTGDPLEMIVRVLGYSGWGWLVGTWAGNKLKKDLQ